MGQTLSSHFRPRTRTRIREDLNEIEEQRLSHFVKEIYDVAKLKHSKAELEDHEGYIRSRVIQPLIDKFNKMHPLLAVTDILLNGSMSNGIKIETPCEYDYVLPMGLSGYKHIRITNLYNGEMFITLTSECYYDLRELIEDHKYEYLLTVLKNLTLYFNPVALKNIIHMALHDCLQELHKEGALVYKRMIPLRNKYQTFELNEKEVFLDDRTHGPCCRLRVWGPLCVTDIDLAFCLRLDNKPHTEDSFYMALPKSLYWIKSFYEKPDLRVLRLSESHRQIMMAIKYTLSQFLLHSTIHRSTETYHSSHVLLTIVRCHQEKCTGIQSVGKCFHDIMNNICEFHLKSTEDLTKINVHMKHRKGIYDTDCTDVYFWKKNRETKCVFGGVYEWIVYNLMRLVKSSDEQSAVVYSRYLEMVTKEAEMEYLKQYLLKANRKRTQKREEILKEQNMEKLLIDASRCRVNNFTFDTDAIISYVKSTQCFLY